MDMCTVHGACAHGLVARNHQGLVQMSARAWVHLLYQPVGRSHRSHIKLYTGVLEASIWAGVLECL